MSSMLANLLTLRWATVTYHATFILVLALFLSSCGGYTRLAIKDAIVSELGGAERKLQPADVPIQSIPQSISENYASLTSKFQEVQFDDVSVTLLHALSGENVMDAADRIDLDIAITNKRDEAIYVDWRSIKLLFENPPETERAAQRTTRYITFWVDPFEKYILARDSGDESKVGKPFLWNGETIHYVSQAENASDSPFSIPPKTTGKLDMAFYRPFPRKAQLQIGVRKATNGVMNTVTLHLAPK